MVAIAFFGAYFVYRITRNKLLKTGNKYPKTISVVTFLCSFIIIFIVIFLLVTYNLRFER